MLTDDCLELERPNLGGVQRVYRFADGHGVSLINSPMACNGAAWEGAVLNERGLDYSTPLTNDVERFDSDEEANEWIAKAKELFGGAPASV